MPRGAVKEKPQSHMEERIVDDPDLLEQLELFAETKAAHRNHMAAKKAIDIRFEKMTGLKAGQVVRCGVFTVKAVKRSGGGFTVNAWTKTLPGKIVDMSAPDAGDDAGDDGDD